VNIDLKTGIDLAGNQNSWQQTRARSNGCGAGYRTGALFHHSSRVYYWSALAGKRRGLKFDLELLSKPIACHCSAATIRLTNWSSDRSEVRVLRKCSPFTANARAS